MGYNCRFEGVDRVEIISVQVAPPAIVAPVAPVAPPAPVISATLVNGVIIVTAQNVAANTPVQVVHDLTADDDDIIDLTGV